MTIAVGIDFSAESKLATRQALEIARHVGGEIVLVHAAGTVELPPPGRAWPSWPRRVVRRAPCSVLIARGRDESAGSASR